jgi:DNA-nicking Smr family endonuclease
MTRQPRDQSRHHGLQVSDHHLWDDVKRGIQPLQRKGARPSQQSASRVKLHNEPPTPIHRLDRFSHSRTNPPLLASFDRKLLQKLSRGQIEPQALIDLHGATLDAARGQLLVFLAARRQHGTRLALVITGKGKEDHTNAFASASSYGKLRREVPLWLEEAPFRAHVVAFHTCHPRHGGAGALYVRLRRPDGQMDGRMDGGP